MVQQTLESCVVKIETTTVPRFSPSTINLMACVLIGTVRL